MPLIFTPLLIILFDQALKFASLRFLVEGDSIPVIKNIFHITLVLNTGAAFGLLKNQTILFIALSIIAISLIVFYLPRLNKEKILSRVALALVLGGAASNLIDRLRFGYVIDYLDFRVWPVFNVADSAITLGAILLLFECFKKK